MKVGFVGLGLIGGSIAKAVRQFYPDCEIIAFDKNKEALALATQESVIDVAATTVDSNFSNCDYIFLCAPVVYNEMYLPQLKEYIHENCILTDAGSVKTNIHKKIEELDMESNFIGGHPMAGSEKSGFINSKAMLIENAFYVLTPTKKVRQELVDRYEAFIKSLHSITIILDYETHDYVVGTISHLPHIIASSLVTLVRDTDTKDELMKNLAAGGFKDITRIASSSPTMWQHICLTNKENILKILDNYIASLESFRGIIEEGNGDRIFNRFSASRNYRDALPSSSAGPIKKNFAVYCDIIDEAGGIATIATILASNGLNLKNIGIINNREFEEGVLRIEFYDENSSKRAAQILKKYRYIVYER